MVFILLTSCSKQTKYEVLSFLFDGVPVPDSLVLSDGWDSVMTDTGMHIQDASNQLNKGSVHYPYEEKDCYACHNKLSMGKLLRTEPELCYSCHDNFSDIYDYVHGPVGGGYCTICHNPHKSEESSLLTRSNDQVCYYCHDQERLEAIDYHFLDELNCTDCHDPHGEFSKQFLKPNTCEQCHGSYNEQYEFVHGPVAAGYCNLCHGSHYLETNYKLIRQGQNLCTECHTLKLVLSNEIHDGIGTMNCTECHSPHGGGDRFMLK